MRYRPYADIRYSRADTMNISEGITTQLLWMLKEKRKEKNSELSAFDIVDKLLSTPYSQSINQ
jgi:hypothetical protein